MGIAQKIDNTLNVEVASLMAAATTRTMDSTRQSGPDSALSAEVERIAGIKHREHSGAQTTAFTTAFSDAEFIIGDELKNQELPCSRISIAGTTR